MMRWMVCVLGLCLAAPSAVLADESAQEAPSTEDWPAIISRLRQQSTATPWSAQIRQQLATAYNNYGVVLSQQGRFEQAQGQLEEASRIDPNNPQFPTNLARIHLTVAGQAYQANQPIQAKAALDRALALDKTLAEAYALRGQLEYESQHLKEAKAAWEQALKLKPDLSAVKKQLDQVSRELPVESKFDRVAQFSFDIRFPDNIERSEGFDIRDVLLAARREVGTDFALWPKDRLVVLVYPEAQFRQLRQETPDWVAGQYDGKIRMPYPSHSMSPASVRQILVHEYTHFLVHQVAGTKCPTWFNEGLAQYEAWKQDDPPWPALRKALAANELIPWDELSSQFSYGLPAEAVQLAYDQSHSIVLYLATRYSFWRLRRILKQVGQDTDLRDALAKELHMKLPKLEQEWRTWLTQRFGGT